MVRFVARSSTRRTSRLHGHRAGLAAFVGLVIVAVGSVPASASEPGGTVPGTVTVEPSVACLLVGGMYDFGRHGFSIAGDVPVAHASVDQATLRSCASGDQDVMVHGTDAVGSAEPAAVWGLDPNVATGCATDHFGVAAYAPAGPPIDLSLADEALVSLSPDASVDVGASLVMPCVGSSGDGQTMSFSVVFTAVLAPTGPNPSPSATLTPSPTPTAGTQRTVTVQVEGDGAGIVYSEPAGLCGGCTASFEVGTVVEVFATANIGSVVGSIGCSGGCVVTEDMVVTVRFDLIRHALTVSRAGSGDGMITSQPAGISCGVDCLESYPFGTGVQLEATATAGSTFVGWSGACVGTSTCFIQMTSARTVTATFDAATP